MKKLIVVISTIILLLALVPMWRHFYPVITSPGWESGVYLDDIDRVSALAIDHNGLLLLSQEISDEHGRILEYQDDHSLKEIRPKLSKPDGMVAFDGGVVFTQEQGQQPLVWTDGTTFETLFNANSLEGVTTDGRYLYAVEDLKQGGRLLQYDPEQKTLKELRAGLKESESIAVCPDGRIYYAEKKSTDIRELTLNQSVSDQDPVVASGLNQPGMLMCDHLGLWITEDATHMARLLLLEPGGDLKVILSHLRSAQTILAVSPGNYLLSEQGRNRILWLHPVSDQHATDR